MKSRRIQLILSVGFFALLCTSFMNGGHVNWDEALLGKVDLKTRNSHARELLGSSYKRSAARFHERNDGLSKILLKRVKRSLPVTHRKYAGLLTQTILEESRKYGFDPVFVLAIIQTESRWNPNAVGGVGEIGLMQIRPETAEWMADRMKLEWKGKRSLYNPVTNVTLGLGYMAYLRTKMGPSSMKYVSAYNMGPKNVQRLLAQKRKPREYRTKVIGNYEMLYRSLPTGAIATARL